MKANIPKGGWLWFWRAHLAVFAALYCLAAVVAFQLPPDTEIRSSFDLLSVLAILLMLLLIAGSIAGEAGYVFQRSFSTRGFWRALFVVFAILWVVGISIMVAIGLFLDPNGIAMPEFREISEWGVSLANLWAIWLYAYRSPHLWLDRIEQRSVAR